MCWNVYLFYFLWLKYLPIQLPILLQILLAKFIKAYTLAIASRWQQLNFVSYSASHYQWLLTHLSPTHLLPEELHPYLTSIRSMYSTTLSQPFSHTNLQLFKNSCFPTLWYTLFEDVCIIQSLSPFKCTLICRSSINYVMQCSFCSYFFLSGYWCPELQIYFINKITKRNLSLQLNYCNTTAAIGEHVEVASKFVTC